MTSKEQNEVYRANEVFYKAFQSLDLSAMEKVWAREERIQCFHPGWGPLRGWEPVMTSWRRIFENTEEIRFLLSEVRIEIQHPLAWVTLYENITSKVGEELVSGVVLTTNIFEQRSKGWFLIHHHGSNVVEPPSQVNPSTFH